MNVTHTSMLSTVVPGVMSMSNRPKNCQFSFRSILRLKINFWDDSKIDNNLLMIDDFVQIDESLPPCTRFQEFIHSQCIMKLMHCTVCCVSCLLSCDLEFVKMDESNNVHVRLTGACGGCPMATMTLKQGVELFLKDTVPEVNEVVQVR